MNNAVLIDICTDVVTLSALLLAFSSALIQWRDSGLKTFGWPGIMCGIYTLTILLFINHYVLH